MLAQDDELVGAIGQGSQGADLAQAPTWTPSQDDFEDARSIIEPFVKDLDDRVDAMWEIGAAVVLLGQPSGELASRVRQQPDYASGTFQVDRSTSGPGSLRFSAARRYQRSRSRSRRNASWRRLT